MYSKFAKTDSALRENEAAIVITTVVFLLCFLLFHQVGLFSCPSPCPDGKKMVPSQSCHRLLTLRSIKCEEELSLPKPNGVWHVGDAHYMKMPEPFRCVD